MGFLQSVASVVIIIRLPKSYLESIMSREARCAAQSYFCSSSSSAPSEVHSCKQERGKGGGEGKGRGRGEREGVRGTGRGEREGVRGTGRGEREGERWERGSGKSGGGKRKRGKGSDMEIITMGITIAPKRGRLTHTQ